MRYLFDTPMDAYMVLFFHDCLLKGKKTFTTGKPAKTVEVTPMQFTGFTTNGQEVYESDILECDSDWYEVVWDQEQGGWLAQGIHSTESISLCEVIGSETWVQGNIHSNPDLLAGSKNVPSPTKHHDKPHPTPEITSVQGEK